MTTASRSAPAIGGARPQGEAVQAVVANIETVAEDVIMLDLRRPNRGAFPPWEPGAHIDVVIPGGLDRQYSLCGDPHEHDHLRIAVLREPSSRGGSIWLHDHVRAGDPLTIRGPKNNFPLVDAAEYLFIAGGIGITPILAMTRQAERAGRPWRLIYGGRRRASMAFLAELSRYGEDVIFWPEDENGLIDLPALLATPRTGVAVYCCGPEPLLAAVESQCARWPAGALHTERFRPKPGLLDAERTPFDVELDLSGRVVHVPTNRTIVEALEEAGIGVPTSCREGTCGTCETVVLDGVPEHRDSFLTDEEKASNEVIMPCCSRARTPVLVLDL